MTLIFTELSRDELTPGVRIQGYYTDSSTNLTYDRTFFVDGTLPTAQDITDRIEYIGEEIIFATNPLNYYELTGADVRPILVYIVQIVRAHPEGTLEALKNAVVAEFPDAFWSIDQLVTHIKAYLENKLGHPITFDEFKLYIINHKFKGVD